MGRISMLFQGINVIFLIIFGILLLLPISAHAQKPFCGGDICNETRGDDGTVFPYTEELTTVTQEFSLGNGDCKGIKYQGQVTITQGQVSGWSLEDVQCDANEGVAVSEIENGIILTCGALGGFATCTFFNIPDPPTIPTLSEWGMISAAAGLGLIGIIFTVRRRKTVVNA